MKKTLTISSPIYFFLIFSLMIYSLSLLMNQSIFSNLSKYGFVFITIILLLVILTNKLFLTSYGITRVEMFFYTIFFFFNTLYLFNIKDLNFNNLLAVFFQFISLFLVFIFSKIHINNKMKKIACYTSSISLVIFVIFGYILEYNSNAISAFIFFVSFFVIYYYFDVKLTKNFINYFQIIILFFLIVFTLLAFESRNVIICLIAGIITYFIWPYLIKSKVLSNLYFTLILACIGLYTFIYPQLAKFIPNIQELEFWVEKYTGKRLFSGREILWSSIIEVVKEKPLLGYGANATPGMFLNTTLSAHNLYLQILLQVGFLGLLLFVVLLFLIWKQIMLIKVSTNRIFATFFICIVLYQVNEVILLQNNFNIGMLQWMIIGLSINKIKHLNMSIEKG